VDIKKNRPKGNRKDLSDAACQPVWAQA